MGAQTHSSCNANPKQEFIRSCLYFLPCCSGLQLENSTLIKEFPPPRRALALLLQTLQRLRSVLESITSFFWRHCWRGRAQLPVPPTLLCLLPPSHASRKVPVLRNWRLPCPGQVSVLPGCAHVCSAAELSHPLVPLLILCVYRALQLQRFH